MKGGVLKDLVFFVDVHSQDNPNGAQSIQSMVETLGGKVICFLFFVILF